jgi:hypothetical protein
LIGTGVYLFGIEIGALIGIGIYIFGIGMLIGIGIGIYVFGVGIGILIDFNFTSREYLFALCHSIGIIPCTFLLFLQIDNLVRWNI